ncbi:MAG: alpha/beta hydrolase [Ktedonobacteraceae bacterium]|nr:alpha/beta hydrolase [Ktedonobacteraceae bacterium]
MLHYRLEGSGPPLLLIHGWGVTYAIWQNLAPLLRTHFQLIMIELPGIGHSPGVDPHMPYYPACAEAIEEVRQFLGFEQWSVLAYSAGTRAAEAYVQRYPQHVTRAVLLCPVRLRGIHSFAVYLLDTVRASWSVPLKRWILSDWRLYGLVTALGFNGRRNIYTGVWKREIELQPRETLIRSLCEMPGKGRAPFAASAVPTLFIWGSRDFLTARPRRPRPNDVFIPANHSAPLLAAAHVAEAVLPFLIEGRLVAPSSRSGKRWRIQRERRQRRPEGHKIRLLPSPRNVSFRRFALRPRQLFRRARTTSR